ncbi:MAG: chemotaxis protein CheW [Scytonema sp. PMC 1069.18]|nr:chemotaxis protein CheW [Scytonema sp. PMC 1069.18]MEC4885220.1 chemotaxis protein CheW [Scytonema sp. PMC 1070.18]
MASDSLPASHSSLAISSPETEQRYLWFQIIPDTGALLPISQLAEVLTIPVGQITPIPQLPAWVMGVNNWRGEVIWMVDLAHLLGFTPWYQQGMMTTHTAIVLRVPSTGVLETKVVNQTIGLVVHRVTAIERCDRNQLQPPSSGIVTPQLIPFLCGYLLKSNGERLAVLNDEVIVETIYKS